MKPAPHDPRLGTPIWRHDAYTLRRLEDRVRAAALAARARGELDPARSTVLDVGAGTAPYRSVFLPHVRRYLAADLGDCDGLDIVIAEREPLDVPPATIDAVLSFQVLEHVWDLDWYLGECRRALVPEGLLLLSTHGTWLYHPHPTDFRRWTCAGLRREIESRGFAVRELLPAVGPLAWTTQFRLLGYWSLLGRCGAAGRVAARALAAAMYARMLLEDAVTPAVQHNENAAVYLVVANAVG